MQIKNRIIAVALLWLVFAGASKSEDKDGVLTPMPDYPHWLGRTSAYSKNFQLLTVVGSIGDIEDIYWSHWEIKKKNIPHKGAVKEIVLNHGYISEKAIRYLSVFENVESITLGVSIEGVTISPAALKELARFQKLAYLSVAVHGLDQNHLKAIREGGKNLKALAIQFPSVLMISGDNFQMRQWKAVKLDDSAAKEISKIGSLESLGIGVPEKRDGSVEFTEEALRDLLKLHSLKHLQIDGGCFTESAIVSIRKLTLPSFVNISEE